MLLVTNEILTQINTCGEFRAPTEAVGLIAKGRVLELPNRSLDSQHGFEIHPADIRLALENSNMLMHATDWEKLVLWHTHPGGLVGPSTTDIRHKVPHLSHLVVTLTPEGPVPVLY